MDTLKKDISSVLIPTKEGVQSGSFLNEFRDLIGDSLNPSQYGFRSVHDLMKSIPDAVKVINVGPGHYIYKAKENEATEHITQMVVRQKAKKRRGQGRGGGQRGRPMGGPRGRWTSSNYAARNYQKPTSPVYDHNANRVPFESRTNFNRGPIQQRLGPTNTENSSDAHNRMRNSSHFEPDSSRRNVSNQTRSDERQHYQQVPFDLRNFLAKSSSTSPPSLMSDPLTDAFKSLQMSDNSVDRSSERHAVDVENSSRVSTRRVKSRGGKTGVQTPVDNSATWSRSSWNDDEDRRNYGINTDRAIIGAAKNSQSNVAPPSSRPLTLAMSSKAPVHPSKDELSPRERIPTNIMLMNMAEQPLLSELQKCSFLLSSGETPQNFFLQRFDGANKVLQSVGEICERVIESLGSQVNSLLFTSPTGSRLRVGEYVILKDEEIGRWCRALIQTGFKQFLIDYGKLEAEFVPCFRMPQKLYEMPAQAYLCQLDNVYPLRNIWSWEACEVFIGEATDCLLSIEVKGIDAVTGKARVDLRTDEDENIADILCSCGYANRQPQTRRVRQSKASYEKLPNIRTIPVRMVCLDSPDVIYLNLTAMSDKYSLLLEEIDDAINQEFDNKVLVKEPKVGEYYVCRDIDCEDFRVKVISVDKSSILVEYLDFGEKSVLPGNSRLYPMKTSFFDLPFQAIKVVLRDFEQHRLNEELKHEMAQRLLRSSLFVDVVGERKDASKASLPLVELLDGNGELLTPEEMIRSLSNRAVAAKKNPDLNWVAEFEAIVNKEDKYLRSIENYISLPSPDKVYIAFHPILGRYCRAKVQHEGDSFFSVLFIDYGSSLDVPKYIIDGEKFLPEINKHC